MLRHDHVGTEHVLLALASARQGIAAAVLADLGVARERILATSCMNASADDHDPRECLSVMPRLKQALEHSRRIADGLQAPAADTEHLLVGIVAVRDSMAVAILHRLKVSPDNIRRALAEKLNVDAQRAATCSSRRGA